MSEDENRCDAVHIRGVGLEDARRIDLGRDGEGDARPYVAVERRHHLPTYKFEAWVVRVVDHARGVIGMPAGNDRWFDTQAEALAVGYEMLRALRGES